MKILITGSSGMLGTCLSKVLAGQHELVGLDITAPCANTPLKDFRKSDITDHEGIETVFNEAAPDLVIHAAAWADVDGCETDPEKARTVNIDGTLNVAEAARRIRVPVLLISTDFVFDGNKNKPYVENDPTSPLSVYGSTKLEAEKVLKQYLDRYVIVRTSWLFCKGGKNFVDTIIAKAEAGEKIRVVDDQVGSPTYALDLARALDVMIGKFNFLTRGVYHISNSGSCSWLEFASRALELAGKGDVAIEAVSSDELGRPATRPKYSVLCNDKFRKYTSYVMRSWQDALKDYIGGK